MADMTMKVHVDMTEFYRALEAAEQHLARLEAQRTRLEGSRLDRGSVPLAIGAAAALAASPRRFTRRGLFGLRWVP